VPCSTLGTHWSPALRLGQLPPHRQPCPGGRRRGARTGPTSWWPACAPTRSAQRDVRPEAIASDAAVPSAKPQSPSSTAAGVRTDLWKRPGNTRSSAACPRRDPRGVRGGSAGARPHVVLSLRWSPDWSPETLILVSAIRILRRWKSNRLTRRPAISAYRVPVKARNSTTRALGR
jgi:hypothetical protein